MPIAAEHAEDAAHFTELLGLIEALEEDEAIVLGRTIRREQSSRATLAEVAELLESGQKTLDSALIWETIREKLRPDLVGENIGAAVSTMIARAVEVLGPPMAEFTARRIGFGLGWEDLASRPRSWAAAAGRDLTEQMVASNPGLLRAQLDLVAAETMELEDAARLIRGSLGLSRPQAQALFSAHQDWLSDASITNSRRRQLLAEYRELLIDSRSRRVAHDWISRSANETQRLSWEQASELAPEIGTQWERRSVGVLSGNICPFCYERHGWRAPIAGAYEDGSNGPPWPHGSGGSTAGCRCTEELVEAGSPEGDKPPFIRPAGGGTLRPMVT